MITIPTRTLQSYRRAGASVSPLVGRAGTLVPIVPLADDDERLVQAILRGDPRAPALLFDRYGQHIQRVLARIVGYAQPERKDLLHDVFVRALERIGDIKNPRALKSWLVGITVFTAREWVRRRRRTGPPLPPEHGSELAATTSSPETAEAFRSFLALMDRLDDEERTMLTLRFLEGMSLQEIADACRLSISTARRRVMVAEERFRKILPEYPALEERLEVGEKP
jgi:RNA polymerase sigma-70 factor (ECF subfamily)